MTPSAKKITKHEFVRFQEADEKVFQKIFDMYHQLIYNYVVSYCKIAEEAEELVQEAFVLLFVNRTKIADQSGIYPYLYVLAKRMTISLFKRKVVESKYQLHLHNNWEEGHSDTEEILHATELSTLLSSIIEELPARQQEVYCLKNFENLSYQEIAEKVGVSKNTVKNHLIAATKTVKCKIAKIYVIQVLVNIIFLD